jgi:predicted RNase H-like HicB family nuclease
VKIPVDVHTEGKYFVAVDLFTNVADQGSSVEEAVWNLKKGLREHYQILIELTPNDHTLRSLEIETDTLFFLNFICFQIANHRAPGSGPQRRTVCCAVREEREGAAGGEEPGDEPAGVIGSTRKRKRNRPGV